MLAFHKADLGLDLPEEAVRLDPVRIHADRRSAVRVVPERVEGNDRPLERFAIQRDRAANRDWPAGARGRGYQEKGESDQRKGMYVRMLESLRGLVVLPARAL
jgi:hypothetical protein